MKKRFLSLALALLMALALLPAAALAAATLSLDKTSYQEGEPITVTISGTPEGASPYVAVYAKGAPVTAYGSDWKYAGAGDSHTFDQYRPAGEYEVRLYAKTYASDADFLTSVPFTITGVTAAGSVSLDKSAYQAGEVITVTVSGVTAEMKKLDPYVGIYEKDAPATAYGDWTRVDAGTSAVSLTAPDKNGDYEMRLYRKTYAADSDLITSAPFAVTGGSGGEAPSGGTGTGGTAKPKADPIPTDSLEGADLNATGNYNWAGKWEDSNYGEILITQNGGAVTGTYPWDNGKITATAQGNMLYGQWAESPTYTPPRDGGDFEFVMSEDGMSFIGHSRYGSDDVWRDWHGKRALETSDWASGEIETAQSLGLIPDVLLGADLTAPITRAEFAAVAVKTYEALSGTAALPATENPFTDCRDVEVLKAYNIGAVNGSSATTFSPDLLLNREQAAAMLTRVFKRVTKPGWTLRTDAQFPLEYAKPAAFSDDGQISSWAKDAVYFMAANGIIQGAGGKFMPKAATAAEEAQGYAQATREQALIIAVRMVEKLGG